MAEPLIAHEPNDRPSRPSRSNLFLLMLASYFGRVGSTQTSDLAVMAVLWYGFLSFTYTRFYEPLGVNPNDVGLTYANVLASSVGLAVPLIILIVLLIIVIALVISMTHKPSPPGTISIIEQGGTPPYLVALTLTLIFGFLIYLLPFTASVQAGRVQRGDGIAASGLLSYPITWLPLRADRVLSIEPMAGSEPNINSQVELLTSKILFYLGQANGLAVLYNSSDDNVIYLPLSSVILRVAKGGR